MKNILHKIILFMLLAFLITIVIAINGKSDKKYVMDDGLNLYYNGHDMHIKSLSGCRIPVKNKGDNIVVSGVFSDDIPNRSTMALMSYHCIVTVKVDNEIIYTYGEEYDDEALMAGDGLYYVTLPEKCQGKKVDILYEACEDNAFTFSDAIYIYNSRYMAFQYVRQHFFQFMVSTFSFILGLAMVIVQMLYGKMDRKARKVLWLGLTFILLGMWIACYYGSINIIVKSNHIIAYIEHFSLFSGLIPLILFYLEDTEKGICRKLMIGDLILTISFVVFTIISEIEGWSHPNRYLNIFHAIACVTLILIFATFIVNKENKKNYMVSLLGIVVLGISFITELIIYRLKEIVSGDGYREDILVPTGMIFFIVLEMLSYLYFVFKYSKRAVQEEVLYSLANKDMLTGIANRYYCEKYLKHLDEDGICNYAILNFDLNWLKRINDTYGHKAGDEYISKFAQLLETYFGGVGEIGRMGGDEFIAILTITERAFIEERLNAMFERAKTYGNKEYCNGEIFYAYGYEISTELEPMLTHEVYELADAKMYKCKKEQKAERI